MKMLLLPLAALAVTAASVPAQSWRTYDVSRQLHDTAEMQVRVQFGAGQFDLRAADEPVLYAMRLRYDEDETKPLDRFDAAAHSLDIGVGDHGSHVRVVSWTGRHSHSDGSEMHLTLARTVPMDLHLELGATEANVDLGGLTLRGLRIESGAADETVDFSTVNRARMNTLEINVGAAEFTARHLANANAASIRVAGGVGALDLNFGGTWTADMDAHVTVALGKVTLHVPRDVGVRLDMTRLLASFSADGLVKRDGSYYSDNWDTAKYHLRIRTEATFGEIEIDRFGPGGDR